ncbi:MAG: L-threonylcarbamoyladenylate synthase [Pikeienuella sp.]
MTETLRIAPDPAGIADAAALLREGALVAFPTETVYGLGADASNEAAVAKIFAAKGRPATNPLILHLPEASMAAELAELPLAARRLAARHWPGPLTLVLRCRKNANIAPGITAGLPTVALRVPMHPVARALILAVGRPVAAPSANLSGRVSPTSAAHVLDGLQGRIAAVVDAGPAPLGLESTILGFEDGRAVMLRPGALCAETLEGTLRAPLGAAKPGKVSAPGQLTSHYATGARLRLNAANPRPGEAWLGLGPVPPGVSGPALTLSRRADLDEAAANLFGHLRALDAAIGGRGIIAVAEIPTTGLGRAINDRLLRAAAPRQQPASRAG